MKRYHNILVIFFLSMAGVFLSGKEVNAQYYFYDDNYYDNPILFEVGGSFGAMNCLTDLGGQPGLGKPFVKDLTLGTTRPSFGGFISATYQNKIALRFEGTIGSLEANDATLKGVTDIAQGRYWRNLSFQTNIREFSLMAEIHPLFLLTNYATSEKEAPRFSPYLLGGVGLFNFNPRAKNNAGVLVDLHPLRLEGQGFPEYPDVKPYKLNQTNVPLGLGVKFELSPLINLRAEMVHRLLFTDYLDDVSGSYIDPVAFYNNLDPSDWENALTMYDRQLSDNKYWGVGGKRGNPDQKDSYFTFNIKVSLLFRSAINE